MLDGTMSTPAVTHAPDATLRLWDLETKAERALTGHTGHILGAGTGGVQDRGSPSYPASVANAFYLAYGLMDTSVLSHRLILGPEARSAGLGGAEIVREALEKTPVPV